MLMGHSLVWKFSIRVRSAFATLLLFAVIIGVSGCVAVRPQGEVKYIGGAVVDSLTGNISLSYSAHGRSISGSGYLMFRRPDQIRAVILSPFGSVLQEVYVSGDLVTIVDAGNGIAFSGSSADLPDKGDFSGWRYIHWLIDMDPPDPGRRSGSVDRVNRFGQPEKAVFENGLLQSKSTVAGGLVSYRRYTAMQGTALPLEITYETVAKEKFTIILEEPEINVPFAAGAFMPNLSKLRVYPLSLLR